VGGLGSIEGSCPDVEEWDEECQGADEIELGKECEKQQEGFF